MSVYFVYILYLVNTFVAFCLKQVKKIIQSNMLLFLDQATIIVKNKIGKSDTYLTIF